MRSPREFTLPLMLHDGSGAVMQPPAHVNGLTAPPPRTGGTTTGATGCGVLVGRAAVGVLVGGGAVFVGGMGVSVGTGDGVSVGGSGVAVAVGSMVAVAVGAMSTTGWLRTEGVGVDGLMMATGTLSRQHPRIVPPMMTISFPIQPDRQRLPIQPVIFCIGVFLSDDTGAVWQQAQLPVTLHQPYPFALGQQNSNSQSYFNPFTPAFYFMMGKHLHFA